MSSTNAPRKKRPVLRTILIVLAVVIVGLVVVVAMQPADFRITRSATMAASPDVVFAQVHDFHKWDAWNPWGKIDPEMSQSYAGEPSGVGAKYAWSGNSQVGEGSMTIVESQPNELIRVQLDFEKPMKGTSLAEFTFAPQGDATEVTWSMVGENNFMAKAIGLVMDMDKMIGGNFEQGLADLKTVAESAAPSTEGADLKTVAESAAPSTEGADRTEAAGTADDVSTADPLVITRVFDAPREAVWQAWTDPERVKQWWGPIGFTSPTCTIDFREGGNYLFCMRTPDGLDFWSTGTYQKIVPLETIVFTDSFADKDGNVVPASHYGMEGDWPDALLVTLTFEEQDGKTQFTLHHEGIPETDKEMCNDGWRMSLDKLDATLKEV